MRDAAASTVKDRAAALPNLDAIIRGLLYVYVFCLPFTRLLFVERNGFLILAVLLALWCVVNRRHFFTRTPIDLPLIAFVGWVALTVPFAVSPLYSLKEFAKLLQQGLIFYVVAYFFRDSLSARRLLWALVGGLAVVSAYGLFQFGGLSGPMPQEGEMMLVESVTPGEVWLTTYLVMLVPLSLALGLCERRPAAQIAGMGTAGLATLCLLLTYSRAGLLALLCEAVAVAWFVRRRAVLIAMALSVLVMVLGSAALFQYDITARGGWKARPGAAMPLADTGTLALRWEAWKFAAGEISRHGLTGVGYGKDKQKEIYGRSLAAQEGAGPARYPGTHNTFLDIALGTGLPGLALFVWLMWRIAATAVGGFRRAGNPAAQAVLLGLGVSVVGLAVRLSFDHMLIGTLALQFWVL
ncbi:MAG: hypothetical protein EPO02_02000, partial [Nitrospirae bacterium]